MQNCQSSQESYKSMKRKAVPDSATRPHSNQMKGLNKRNTNEDTIRISTGDVFQTNSGSYCHAYRDDPGYGAAGRGCSAPITSLLEYATSRPTIPSPECVARCLAALLCAAPRPAALLCRELSPAAASLHAAPRPAARLHAAPHPACRRLNVRRRTCPCPS